MKASQLLSVARYIFISALLFPGYTAFGQIFQISSAEIVVSGIAREKPWLMTANEAEGATELVFLNGQLKSVRSLKFSINAYDLKSKNEKMDQRAYKALKAYPYDKITFLGKIFTVKDHRDNSYLLEVTGNLSLAGVTRITSVLIILKVNDDGTISCTSSSEVNISDFKVSLNAAEKRTMRLNDQVRIEFRLMLSSSNPGKVL